MDFRNRTALVTGASSGIGAEMAAALAARGADLVLVARRADRLETLAERLRQAYGVSAIVLAQDLAKVGAAAALAEELASRGLAVDVLVNNAGFGTRGRFVDEDPGRIGDEMALNVVAVVELTRALLPGMVQRGYGAVVNVASTAAYQPLPHMAVYGATKAFVLSFTEALWGELEGTGVHALALCPGATETEFFGIVGEASAVGAKQSAADVVATAMGALDRRTPPPSVISGRRNALVAALPRLFPRRLTVKVAGRAMSE